MPFLNYAFISALALVVDVLSGLVAHASGLSIPGAASLGYFLGLVTAFPLMRRFVFRLRNSSQAREIMMFFLSGVIGIAATTTVSLVAQDLLEWTFLEAKALAVVLSFIAVFFFRFFIVFNRFIV